MYSDSEAEFESGTSEASAATADQGVFGFVAEERYPFFVGSDFDLECQFCRLLSAPSAGMLAAAVTGWVAVWGTLKFVRSRTFTPFVVYRIAAGLFVLSLLATNVR